MHKLRSLACLVWLVGSLAAAGCSRSSGTYVVLDFEGTVSNLAPIHSIALDLDMGGQKAPTVFTAPGGGDIQLPTDAVLQIQHGSGDLTVTATAKAANGTVLGTGKGSGTAVAGQTRRITVLFGSVAGDAGTDSGTDGRTDSSGDTTTDAPADRAGQADVENTPDGPGGSGAVDGAAGGAGGAGGGTGGTAGVGGAGGSARDGGPDGPGGGTGGGGTGGAGGVTGVVKIVSEPSLLPFVDQPIGSKSAPLSTIIRNLGNTTAPALSVKLPPLPSSFAIQMESCSGKILAPNDTCTISVVFSPTALGGASAALSVMAGSVGGTDITLTGTGVAKPLAALTLQPGEGTLGVVDVGNKGSVTFTVTNTGSSPASGLLVSNTGGPAFQLASDQCSNRVLAANASCTFLVTFAPSASGPFNGNVTVNPSDGTPALAAILTGTGRDYVTLTVRLAGNGTGTVSAAGLTCQPAMCAGQYPRTDPTNPPSVTLTAKPDLNSTFGGWTNAGACAAGNPCTLALSSSTTVTATFNTTTVTPTVQVGLNAFGLAGHTGSLVSPDGTLVCSGSCAPVSRPAGVSITLSAKPDPGFTFIGWTEGPCRGTSPQCTFTPTSDVIVSATFGPQAYMFVTSTMVVPGKLGGVAGGDAECMKRAAAAGLAGTYRAWLASSAGPASSRVGNGGWVRLDGRPFGRNIATLGVPTNQVVYYPPRIDELGNDVGPGHVMVATGGNLSGSPGPCADYTDTTQDFFVGDAIAGSGTWAASQAVASGCSSALRLYCFRSDMAGDMKPLALPGRRVFVTASGWSPSGGIASADAFCRADAAAAGLASASTNTFIALLATSTASAASRLNTGGSPWKRVDDVFVFNSPNDLIASKLLAPFGLIAKGTQYGTFLYWSGAMGPRDASPVGLSCQDWSTSAATDSGLFGNANLSGGPEWFADVTTTTNACNRTDIRLLCAEP